MILAGDVGGTKVHLALFEKDEQKVDRKYKSRDYADFSSLLADFISQNAETKIESACFGIAGPVQNGKCHATNLPWVIDAQKLGEHLKIPSVWLINDLEANAWGLRCLKEDELAVLNPGVHTEGNGALISAGTGLGEAGLYWDGKSHTPFACEGGHVDFAPRSDEEIELWRYLKKKYEHVSFERVLSGPGLYQIYLFLVDTGREKRDEAVVEEKEPQRVIGERAVAKESAACEHAVELFASIYGSEAGNLALKLLATGGVYIGGGIAPKILPILQNGGFMKAFTAKGRFNGLLGRTPVRVVLNDNTALLGAARYAKEKK